MFTVTSVADLDVFCYRNRSICRFRGPFGDYLAEELKIKVYSHDVRRSAISFRTM